jgi:hypothetical protein
MKYQFAYSRDAIRDLDRVWSEVFKASKSYDVAGTYLDDFLNKTDAKAACFTFITGGFFT